MTLQDLLHEAGKTNSPHIELWFPGLARPLRVGVDNIYGAAANLAVSHVIEPPQVSVEFGDSKLSFKRHSGETLLELEVKF